MQVDGEETLMLTLLLLIIIVIVVISNIIMPTVGTVGICAKATGLYIGSQ